MKKSPVAIAVQDALWAGNEMSFHAFMVRMANIENRVVPQAGLYGKDDDDDEEKVPYLLTSVQDGIAVIEIKGPMTNQTSYWDAYDKAATYPAIREALIHAASDPNVKGILLDIDSGGGAVSGVADTARLVRTINDKMKPVVSFSGGSMFSAAYWVGSAAGEVYASKATGVGSIGVIGTHMEVSKMYEEMGINVTVMRAGKFKALANRFEPLTDAAKEQMQSGLDAAYGVFVQHVADMRGVSYNKADTQMAQGKEFYGDAAKSAGLVDGITTFDDVMSKLQSSVDKQQVFAHNSQNIYQRNIMKTALTEQQIAAAAASGVVVTAATPAAPEAAKPTTPAAGTDAPATPEAKPEGEAAAAAAAPAAAPAAEAAAPAQAATLTAADALVPYLQSQIATKDAMLVTANVEIAGLKAKVTDFEASMSGLIAIAAKSTNNMRVALGGSATDMSAMSATQILAAHAAAEKEFTSKFVAGGVAAVDAAQDTKKAGAGEIDSLELARLNAVM